MSDSQSGTFVPPAAFSTAAGPVGPAGVEPATSSLSGTRSNQLSYEPLLARPATARLRPVAWSALPPAEAGLELRTSAHVSRPLVTTTTSESHILTRRPRLSITQIRKSCQEISAQKNPSRKPPPSRVGAARQAETGAARVPDSWRHFSGGTPLFRPVSNHGHLVRLRVRPHNSCLLSRSGIRRMARADPPGTAIGAADRQRARVRHV
jgi:hypothetical protein